MHSELSPQPVSERGAPPCTESEGAVALVLEGPPSPGAYQNGILRALREGGPKPCWACGAALGACYAALIAGNPPERRLERIQQFSKLATSLALGAHTNPPEVDPRRKPSLWLAWLQSTLGAAHVPEDPYEGLRAILLGLVDFERINHAETRLSLGAYDAASTRLAWFDNREGEITPEQVIASLRSPLPPGRTLLETAFARTAAKPSIFPIALDSDSSGQETRNAALFALVYGAARAPRLEAALA